MSQTTTRSFALRIAALSLAGAVALGTLSSFMEREGPELVDYGDICGVANNEPCLKPVLKGGFPIAYLFDRPGVSVERKLAFVEDRLEPWALALDVGIFWAAIVAVLRLSKRNKPFKPKPEVARVKTRHLP